jgi:hypothetical protein
MKFVTGLAVRLREAGRCDEERDPGGELEGSLLLPLAALAEVVAVVRNKHHDRAVGSPHGIEGR